LDTKKSHYIKIVLDEIFGEANFRNEIVWKRQSAHSDSTKCGAIHDTLFFYTNASDWTWNEVLTEPSPDYVEEFFDCIEPETNRRYARGDLSAGGLSGGGYEYEFRGIKRVWRAPKSTMERYEADGRLHWPKSSKGVPRLKRYLDKFKGVPLQDIWADVRVIHNLSRERTSYPTQKPEALLDRVIKASSNPGDIVLDCFVGSGTTLAVAEKLKRNWIGIDCGKLAIYTIQKRMLDLREKIGNKGKHLPPKPFTLYNAGLYDFSKLKRLPWEGWSFFALHLFQCRDDPHTVGGVELDGYRGADDVLVFDHLLGGGVVLDYGFIDDLHNQIGGKVGAQFFIIAPAASVIFLEDYIDKGRTRYYILRIPYSIINELHTRDFEAITQPVDESQVNETVEAVGFDFIRLPQVACEYLTRSREGKVLDEAIIHIKTFKSKALAKGATQKENLETLSMVMVDYDYPFKQPDDEEPPPFEPDRTFFAGEIEKNGWEVLLPLESLGQQVMIIYIDIYGNEYREIKTPADFESAGGDNA